MFSVWWSHCSCGSDMMMSVMGEEHEHLSHLESDHNYDNNHDETRHRGAKYPAKVCIEGVTMKFAQYFYCIFILFGHCMVCSISYQWSTEKTEKSFLKWEWWNCLTRKILMYMSRLWSTCKQSQEEKEGPLLMHRLLLGCLQHMNWPLMYSHQYIKFLT